MAESTRKLKPQDVAQAMKMAQQCLAGLANTVPVTHLGRDSIVAVAATINQQVKPYLADPAGMAEVAKTALGRASDLLGQANEDVLSEQPEPGIVGGILGMKGKLGPNQWVEGQVGQDALGHVIEDIDEAFNALENGEVEIPPQGESEDDSGSGNVEAVVYTDGTIVISGDPQEVPEAIADVCERFGIEPTGVELAWCSECRYLDGCPHVGKVSGCAGVESHCGDCKHNEDCPKAGTWGECKPETPAETASEPPAEPTEPEAAVEAADEPKHPCDQCGAVTTCHHVGTPDGCQTDLPAEPTESEAAPAASEGGADDGAEPEAADGPNDENTREPEGQ